MEEIHLTPEEIKDFNKLISSAWNRINYAIDNIGFEHYATELFNLNMIETKQHDRFRGEDTKRGITKNEECKYFSVLRLVEYAFNLEGYKPEVKDYLHTKKSLFYTYAVALNYGDKIRAVITEDEAIKIRSISYTQLI
jgi:hypothetical protein